MYRTTIMLPEILKAQAVSESSSLGISLGEFVRKSVAMALNANKTTITDTLFSDTATYAGDAPSDTVSRHDEFLYGKIS